jgi:hypothetical protein
VAKGERTYLLKMQSGYDGLDREWHGKGRKDVLASTSKSDLSITIRFERTYQLKMQSGYDGLDREWHGKGRKDVLAEGAEQVRQSQT